MPELSKACDPFRNDLSRGLLFGETGPSSNRGFQLPFDGTHFLNGYSDYGSTACKPAIHEYSKATGVATQVSPFAEFFGGANCFLPAENELRIQQQQQQSGKCEFSEPFGLDHNFSAPSPPTLPFIDDCTSWITDVLEDIPAIHQDLPATTITEPDIEFDDHDFDFITSEHSDFPSAIGFSKSLPDLREPKDSLAETSAVTSQTASSSPPAIPAVPRVLPNSPVPPKAAVPLSVGPPSPSIAPSILKSQSASSNMLPAAEEAASTFTSPTPPSLRTRRARPPKASQKRKAADGEQWEHVQRERQRRDDMSLKISTLESLLPAQCPMSNLKKDRATIVHDSVHYVRSLQQQVEDLKKRLSDLEHRKQSQSIVNRAIAREHANSKSSQVGTNWKSGKFVEYHIEVEGDCDGVGARLEKCRCRPDYMSCAMRVFEDLNLNVVRCTMTRMVHHTMCFVVAKPRASANQAVSSSAVVDALRSSITLV